MFSKILVLLLLVMVPCVAHAQTEEFTVAVVSELEVPLTDTFNHFSMASTADMLVRFVIPTYGSNGQQVGFNLSPAADPLVPKDSGPHPDESDSTLTVYTAKAENIYNDIGAKKLLFTGTGTVTIKAKK